MQTEQGDGLEFRVDFFEVSIIFWEFRIGFGIFFILCCILELCERTFVYNPILILFTNIAENQCTIESVDLNNP